MRINRLIVWAALTSAVILGARQAGANEMGVSAKEIVLGQSCALDGPAKALGQGMRAGLEACFAAINQAGGLNGRTIRLVSKDDGYEPERAIANTRAFIEKDKVFMLIGEVGTPTATAVLPIAEEAGVPFFGPFTGAEFLRTPFKKVVVNVRGSYYQEMEALAAYLVDRKGMTNIACFYQNDGYGQAGLEGIRHALTKRTMTLAATGSYERNTTAVKSALLRIRSAKPEAVIMVGAYGPCAEFIKLAKTVGLKDTIFCNISFVGTKALQEALGDAGEGCIISQVVTFPWDDTIPIVKEYGEAMKAHQPGQDRGFVSLEGYIVGRLFADVVRAVGDDLTREAFLATLDKTGTFDLSGLKLMFGPQDHQGMDEIFLTVIRDQRVRPLKEE